MRRHFWIPLTLLLLVPVPVVLLSHHTVEGYGQGGELILGIAALDSVLAEADGRPVLLNFWATWCAPCVRELPELEHLQRELQGDAVFLAVDIGDPDLSTLSSFLENRPVGLTVVWLNPSEAQTVSARYGLPDALPVTIVLDGGGEESRRAVGAGAGNGSLPRSTEPPLGSPSPLRRRSISMFMWWAPRETPSQASLQRRLTDWPVTMWTSWTLHFPGTPF